MRAEGILRALLDKLGASAFWTARRATPSLLTTTRSSEAMVVFVNVCHHCKVVCSGALTSKQLPVTLSSVGRTVRRTLHPHQDRIAGVLSSLHPTVCHERFRCIVPLTNRTLSPWLSLQSVCIAPLLSTSHDEQNHEQPSHIYQDEIVLEA